MGDLFDDRDDEADDSARRFVPPGANLDSLKGAAAGCTACPLHERSSQTVFGRPGPGRSWRRPGGGGEARADHTSDRGGIADRVAVRLSVRWRPAGVERARGGRPAMGPPRCLSRARVGDEQGSAANRHVIRRDLQPAGAVAVPDYELWIAEGNKTLDTIHARNAAHALAMYGEQLGLHLTLDDQDDAAYGMLRETSRTETPRWAERHNVPVWSRVAG